MPHANLLFNCLTCKFLFLFFLAKGPVQLVLKWYLGSLMETSFLVCLMQNIKMEFTIEHTWDDLPVSHKPVTIGLKSYDGGLLMVVNAPFFNDPPAPLGEPGKPFRNLWDYEGKCNGFAAVI